MESESGTSSRRSGERKDFLFDLLEFGPDAPFPSTTAGSFPEPARERKNEKKTCNVMSFHKLR